MHWDDDGDTVKLSISGGPTDSYTFQPDETSSGLGARFAHTSDQLTMTLSAESQEEEDTAWASNVTIMIGDYSIGVESKLITVTETEDVTVTAIDEFGNPMEGLTLDVVDHDSSIIAPQGGSVTIGGDGTADLQVQGITEGSSPLVLAAPDGKQGASTQTVGKHKISISIFLPPGVDTLYPGKDAGGTITVLGANDQPRPGVNPFVRVLPGGTASVTVFGSTNAEGVVPISIRALKATPAEGGRVEASMDQKNWAEAPLVIAPIVLSATGPAALEVGEEGAFTVTASAGGSPIEGVDIDPVLGGGLALVSSNAETTSATGEQTFLVRATAAGDASFFGRAGETPSNTITVSVTNPPGAMQRSSVQSGSVWYNLMEDPDELWSTI